jgi:hypothetical protein
MPKKWSLQQPWQTMLPPLGQQQMRRQLSRWMQRQCQQQRQQQHSNRLRQRSSRWQAALPLQRQMCHLLQLQCLLAPQSSSSQHSR